MRLIRSVLVRTLALVAGSALAITGIVLVRQLITAYQLGWHAPLGSLILATLAALAGWVAPVLIMNVTLLLTVAVMTASLSEPDDSDPGPPVGAWWANDFGPFDDHDRC